MIRAGRADGEMRLRSYVPIALALASAGPVLSAESDADLDSVIVTATRTPEPADQTLTSVTVLTRDDIDRLQPHSVAELLADFPVALLLGD